jgi:hypothetical protein
MRYTISLILLTESGEESGHTSEFEPHSCIDDKEITEYIKNIAEDNSGEISDADIKLFVSEMKKHKGESSTSCSIYTTGRKNIYIRGTLSD